MNDEQDSESHRVVAWILGIAVTIAILTATIPALMIAIGGGAATSAAPAKAAAVAPATVNPPATTVAAANTKPAASKPASGPVVGPVKLYFGSGKVKPGPDSADLLKPVVAALQSGRASRVVLSGFHDQSGNPRKNAELAKSRAKAVRDQLVKAGVSEARIEMRKPEQSSDAGSGQQARRVEVTAYK